MKYRIEGEPFPVVTCDLEAGEQLITESGGMSWMTPNMPAPIFFWKNTESDTPVSHARNALF